MRLPCQLNLKLALNDMMDGVKGSKEEKKRRQPDQQKRPAASRSANMNFVKDLLVGRLLLFKQGQGGARGCGGAVKRVWRIWNAVITRKNRKSDWKIKHRFYDVWSKIKEKHLSFLENVKGVKSEKGQERNKKKNKSIKGMKKKITFQYTRFRTGSSHKC